MLPGVGEERACFLRARCVGRPVLRRLRTKRGAVRGASKGWLRTLMQADDRIAEVMDSPAGLHRVFILLHE